MKYCIILNERGGGNMRRRREGKGAGGGREQEVGDIGGGSMGAGMFFQEGGQERNWHGSADFFTLHPYFRVCPPWIKCYGRSKAHRCPPKSLNVKRELFYLS